MEYYIFTGKKEGPFSAAELKEKRILAETPVWHPGLVDWAAADTILELSVLFTKSSRRSLPSTHNRTPTSVSPDETPAFIRQLGPPLKPISFGPKGELNPPNPKTARKISKKRVLLAVVIFLLLTAGLFVWFYRS